jgi:putative PIN family toxin of toxin-antitoxin system
MSQARGTDRPRIIVDANVFVSYLLKPDDRGSTIHSTVRAAASDRFELMVPEKLIAELRRAPDRPKFAGRIPAERVEIFVGGMLDQFGTPAMAPESARSAHVRDPNDRWYLLEAAIYHDVDILISGDKHLLILRGLLDRPRIMSPADFVAEFGDPAR